MPETNGDLLESRPQSKKRRIPGACDICKRKKIRCDSGEMPDNRCSNCVQFGFECTHKEVTKTLGPSKGYVESLEARLEKMDRLLTAAGVDVNQEVDRMESPSFAPPQPELLPRNDDECSSNLLTLQLRKLTLNPQEHRFLGKSSGYQLIQTAWDLKQEYTGEPKNNDFSRKRKEFWDVPPWITSHPEHTQELPAYVYPDEDLMLSLIDLFFVHINHFLPLLHRPTFEKSVAERLHFSDPMFGATLLLVCAHGARYSDDRRVLADGSDSPRSAGWKWFEQLHVSFGQSSETRQGVWAQIGLAVRLSQEVGAHRRRKASDALPSTEDELWKRAFWVLMTLDRHISASSGRPCGLQDEDFDLDLPLECDDEYWERGFQQPAGKPSSIAFFNCYLRLLDIMAYAMRLVYPIKRPSNTFGSAPLSEQQVIAELDSAMNNWMDSVPSHLRWNPNCDNPLFLKQSAALHATYYHLQIFIHRPFIPSPRNPIPVAFPSLAICTNAARSCCHVLESFSKLSALPLNHLQITAFTAALILLLNIWSGKRSGYAPNPKREMEDVRRCMEILRACERRWASAGRYRDILNELAFAGDVTIPTNQPTATSRKKRFREADDDPPTVSPPVSPTDQPRSMAGTRRVSLNLSPPTLHQIPQQQQALFSLPMYGNELGRLPIYGQFSFSDAIGPHSRVPIQMSAFDHIVLSNLASAPTGPGLPSNTDAYVVDSLFNGQTTESLANHNNSQQSTTSTDWASLFADNTFDFDGLSQFGTMPAMDNDTMAMWSTAPRGLELDDWNTYISSVEQITQAQSQSNTHS
ncbi:fungal-specific transcription factor domain-containing protein [Flammula alnicola]|nr:fungal-specific transcription factor domain-containing protein [Flammula alnicola]